MSPSCSILSSHLHFGAQRIPASMGDMKAPFADISDIPISETAAKIYNFLQSRKYFVKNFKRTKKQHHLLLFFFSFSATLLYSS